MKYQANHFKKYIYFGLFFSQWIASISHAQEIFYFSDHARDLEVSSNSETMLSFPSPPYARVCQPSGILDLYPIESADDLESVSLPLGFQDSGSKGLPLTGDSPQKVNASTDSELTASHLKLIPKKTSGSAVCAIRLSNEQVINVRFILNDLVSKPLIEFRSLLEKARSGSAYNETLGPINIFRAILSGGDLAFLVDDTPTLLTSNDSTKNGIEILHSKPFTKSTPLASYRLEYVGTDKDLYKAWRFEGLAEKEIATSQDLRNVKIGELYFSAFQRLSQEKSPDYVPTIHSGEKFKLFVLSRGDISAQEMMEKLP